MTRKNFHKFSFKVNEVKIFHSFSTLVKNITIMIEVHYIALHQNNVQKKYWIDCMQSISIKVPSYINFFIHMMENIKF